jgi:conjugal transfer/entry exclusion protein
MSFWTWLFGDGTTVYTKEDIDDLVEQIKKFDAGAIDEYLSQHVDSVYARWLTTYRRES